MRVKILRVFGLFIAMLLIGSISVLADDVIFLPAIRALTQEFTS